MQLTVLQIPEECKHIPCAQTTRASGCQTLRAFISKHVTSLGLER